MSKFEKNLNQLSHNFKEWDNILHTCYRCHALSQEIDTELSFQMQKLLDEILELFIGSFRTREQWGDFKTYPSIYSHNVHTVSTQTGVQIEFGVNFSQLDRGHVFYLDSSIVKPHNLRRMKDNFWQKFLSLENIGDFVFNENVIPNSEANKLFVNKKSNLFKLIRNFMLITMHNPESIRDIGNLTIKWDIMNMDWKEMIENANSAFLIFYSLNQMLYKSGA